jgi:PDZ domain
MKKLLAILGIAGALSSSAPTFAGPGGGGGRGGGGGGFGGGARPGGFNGGYRGGYGYGYRGYGYGWGGGFGIGIGFGFYDSPWLYATPGVIGVTPVPAPFPVQQDRNAPAPAMTSGPTGMKITSLVEDGTAAKGSLRVGDIILSVGTTRTSNFDELRSALGSVNEADIAFINGENGKLEKLPIKVANGKIGVAVQEVQLPPPPANPSK